MSWIAVIKSRTIWGDEMEWLTCCPTVLWYSPHTFSGTQNLHSFHLFSHKSKFTSIYFLIIFYHDESRVETGDTWNFWWKHEVSIRKTNSHGIFALNFKQQFCIRCGELKCSETTENIQWRKKKTKKHIQRERSS